MNRSYPALVLSSYLYVCLRSAFNEVEVCTTYIYCTYIHTYIHTYIACEARSGERGNEEEDFERSEANQKDRKYAREARE